MAIDTYWTWVATGSLVTSAITHNLFGDYRGLSDLGASEVVTLKIKVRSGEARLSGNTAVGATKDVGLLIEVSDGFIELPPMVRTEASQVTIARSGKNNPVIEWVIWTRVP